MTKKEAVERLCALASHTAEKKFKWSEPADCFCGADQPYPSYRFSEKVLKFIEDAVNEALKKEA